MGPACGKKSKGKKKKENIKWTLPTAGPDQKRKENKKNK
jgi:hypothetical protein